VPEQLNVAHIAIMFNGLPTFLLTNCLALLDTGQHMAIRTQVLSPNETPLGATRQYWVAQ